MATETQTAPETPTGYYTVFSRVASIPLISDSLAAVHATLAGNAYTKVPYSTAQAWGSAAYRSSEPIQTRLAPIQARLAPVFIRADGYANKAVDAVESRYPYPFHTPSEEIYGTLKQHTEHAYGVANKTLGDKVTSPAFGLATGIDQRLAPVVDKFASVVNSINPKQAQSDAPAPDAAEAPVAEKETYQYQRAYRLSIELKDSLKGLTAEHIKQIQEHNILVQRAANTAQAISNTIHSSYDAASTRVHSLSDTMIAELHSLQASASALPAQAHASLDGLSERLGAVISEVKSVLRSDRPVSEKLSRLRETVEQRVQPLLSGATARVQTAVSALHKPKDEKATTTNDAKMDEKTD